MKQRKHRCVCNGVFVCNFQNEEGMYAMNYKILNSSRIIFAIFLPISPCP